MAANHIFDLLNDVTDRIVSQFEIDGVSVRAHDGARYGKDGKGGRLGGLCITKRG